MLVTFSHNIALRRIFRESGFSRLHLATCTVGDKMGCGIEFSDDRLVVYFTRNGRDNRVRTFYYIQKLVVFVLFLFVRNNSYSNKQSMLLPCQTVTVSTRVCRNGLNNKIMGYCGRMELKNGIYDLCNGLSGAIAIVFTIQIIIEL